MSAVASTERAVNAPGGATVAATRADDAVEVRNPNLGLRLLGYSRAHTNALLEEAARMIEQLSAELVEQRWARAEAEAKVVELERRPPEPAPVPIDDAWSERIVGQAFIAAQREAARIVQEAEQRALLVARGADAEVQRLREEADELRMRIQAERERWVSTLETALAAARPPRPVVAEPPEAQKDDTMDEPLVGWAAGSEWEAL
ncbi:MAG: hypothetical protein JOZ56_03515 [Actinobacteria bacterium]|nr:hypothetical protein [Actinomycetota bacterium]